MITKSKYIKLIGLVVSLALIFSVFSTNADATSLPKTINHISSAKTNQIALDEKPPEPVPGVSSEFASHTGNGPFGPPAATDTVFTVDSASDLDVYLFYSSSPIEFNINLDRVVGRVDSSGYLLEPDKLIQNGIISPKAHLQLLVYDVDEDYGGTEVVREIDRIYINDHYIGNLTGANETWSVTRLDFDIRYLKFAKSTCLEFGDLGGQEQLEACHTAPVAAQNTIRIEIDTGNGGADIWAVEVDWGAISFEAARPALFVHGKGGSSNGGGYDYWDKYDGQYYFNFRGHFNWAGYLTAITENRLGAEASIADNAKILKTIVAELKTRYGVKRINIVAHSKGGLDSRGYISNSALNTKDDVEVLLTLASPHHGSYLADIARDHPTLAGIIGQTETDALWNVSENFMNNTFNPSFPGKSSVRYYSVAADSGADYWYGRDIPIWQVLSLPELSQQASAPLAWLILRSSGTYKGENDFLVTLGSTKWDGISGHASNSYYLGSYSLNHHSIRAAERQAYEQDLTIVNLVKGVLDIFDGSSGSWLQSEPSSITADQAETVSSASNLGVFDGVINQMQTTSQVIGVDSTTMANFSLVWNNGDLYINLRAPDGTLITPSSIPSDSTYMESRDGGALNEFINGKTCVYNIINPQPGQWTAEITSADILPDGASEWALILTQDSPVSIALETDQLWYKTGNLVTLSASVLNGSSPVIGSVVLATIQAPGGGTQALSLLDNGVNGDAVAGDGQYTNQFVVDESGTYRISVDASGDVGILPFIRTSVIEFSVGSGEAFFGTSYSDQGIDADFDGYFEKLQINVPVEVLYSGEYRILGSLYDASDVLLGYADQSALLDVGNHSLALEFDGKEIAEKAESGYLYLRDLRLINLDYTTPLQLDFLENAYTTQSYLNEAFQHPPISLTGINSDFGIDINSNGFYDYLAVNIETSILQEGTYYWNARLVDAQGYEFGWSSGSDYLLAGSNQLQFTFVGQSIYDHQVDGPYYLKDMSMWGNSDYLNVIDVAQTSSYLYEEFEPSPQEIYLPMVFNFRPLLDTYEPNETLSTAYGPLTTGQTYTSYISSIEDMDYYYFDVSSLGKISITLENIDTSTTDLDLYLLDSNGFQIGGSWGTTDTESLLFQPISVGRYYVFVDLWGGGLNPTNPYYLTVQYDGVQGSGDISGQVQAFGAAMPRVPISLVWVNNSTSESEAIWTITNESGEFHFWGMETLEVDEVYYTYYGYDMGSDYLGYWYGPDITTYAAGSFVSAENVDISPINLIDPNSTTSIPLPVTFTWTTRDTSPLETYYLRLYDPVSKNTWWSSNLGHQGSFTLSALPEGFSYDAVNYWRVFVSSASGGFGGSYYSNYVSFAPTTVAVSKSEKNPFDNRFERFLRNENLKVTP